MHSLVNFTDGSTSALLASHDMRIPIFYALNWPDRNNYNTSIIDLLKTKKLTFEKINNNLKSSINMAYYVLKKGGVKPLIFNAANEIAVSFYLEKKIKFMDIQKVIKKLLSMPIKFNIKNVDNIYSADKNVREITREYIYKINGNIK